jgi:hypothetical protein
MTEGRPRAGGRPRPVTVAASLAFVVGGLVIFAGLLVAATGGSAVGVGGLGGWAVAFGLAVTVAGALFIWAGGRAFSGRGAVPLIGVAALAVLVQGAALVRGGAAGGLVLLVISAVIGVLLILPASTRWFRNRGA